jgi:protein-disulfide isomerase
VWRTFSSTAPNKVQRDTPAAPRDPQSTQGVAIEGEAAAPVVLIEYSDFECPYCRSFANEVLPALRSEYVASGKIRIAFRHFPGKGRPRAQRFAEGAICAAAQKRFWPLHNSLFANRPPQEVDLRHLIESVGADGAVFEACMKRKPAEMVSRDIAAGQAIGVFATPTFFIGRAVGDAVVVTKVLMGARPIEEFRGAIDTLLAGSK